MRIRSLIGGLAASLMLGLAAPALADEQDNRSDGGLQDLLETQRSIDRENAINREAA